jgi:sortase A
MKNQINGRMQKICILAGVCLLVVAIGVLIFWQWSIHTSARKAEYYVNTLHSLMPEPRGAVPEERRDNTMSTLSMDGIDFVGLLEIPRYGSALPVCADWGTPAKYPCQFYGSIYDRTMQIGGTSQKGQYDFYREISVGDAIYFTDMEGNRYAYSVTDVRYEKSADQAALQRKDASLTLFIKNIYALDYIIIFCDVLS